MTYISPYRQFPELATIGALDCQAPRATEHNPAIPFSYWICRDGDPDMPTWLPLTQKRFRFWGDTIRAHLPVRKPLAVLVAAERAIRHARP